MKKELIAAAAVLSMACAVPAFADEGIQSPSETASDFEQVKAYYLKKVESRMNRLQQEKTCIEEAQNQDEIRNCKWKNKSKSQGQSSKKKESKSSSGSGD